MRDPEECPEICAKRQATAQFDKPYLKANVNSLNNGCKIISVNSFKPTKSFHRGDKLTPKIINNQNESISRPWNTICKNNFSTNPQENRIHKSNELLLACSWPEPPIYPALILKYLQEAESVFSLQCMPERVVSTRISIAFIHCQIGEERNAIALLHQAIAKPSLLKAEAMARAIYILALAHSRLGEIETAMQWVDSQGMELADMACAQSPWLPAMMEWARIQILWKAFLYKHHPQLWCGPPPESGLVQMMDGTPGSDVLQSMLKKFKQRLPGEYSWAYADLLLHALRGLDCGESEALAEISALGKIADMHQIKNPPIYAWAQLCIALIHCNRKKHNQALESTALAKCTTQSYQLDGLHRNVLVYEYHIRELQSDYSGALSSLKSLNILRLKSVAISPYLEKPRFTKSHEPVLRELEPPHVKRAMRYIEENIHKKILIQTVADHCQVSRRTLETAFRNSRSCTVGDYIRQSKIHLAAESLLTSRQTIGHIASQLGYSSPSAFSRDFSSYYGISPSMWMRHHFLE